MIISVDKAKALIQFDDSWKDEKIAQAKQLKQDVVDWKNEKIAQAEQAYDNGVTKVEDYAQGKIDEKQQRLEERREKMKFNDLPDVNQEEVQNEMSASELKDVQRKQGYNEKQDARFDKKQSFWDGVSNTVSKIGKWFRGDE